MGVSYDLFIEPEVHASRHTLPGKLRQRVRHAIAQLATEPRPHESRPMNASDLDMRPDVELRRIRLERWRIIYAVCEAERWVWVLAIRRRPPYGYDDLAELVARLPPP